MIRMLRYVHLTDTVMCLILTNSTLLCNASKFYVEMMGLIGAGNNPMVGMTVAVAVAIEDAMK